MHICSAHCVRMAAVSVLTIRSMSTVEHPIAYSSLCSILTKFEWVLVACCASWKSNFGLAYLVDRIAYALPVRANGYQFSGYVSASRLNCIVIARLPAYASLPRAHTHSHTRTYTLNQSHGAMDSSVALFTPAFDFGRHCIENSTQASIFGSGENYNFHLK